MTLICEYCKNEFSSNRELHRHQKRTKAIALAVAR